MKTNAMITLTVLLLAVFGCTKNDFTPDTDSGSTSLTSIDINSDGYPEIVTEVMELPVYESYLVDQNQDNIADELMLGLLFLQGRVANSDIDGDEEEEIVVTDAERDPRKSESVDIDGDGDPDIVVLGTKDGAERKDDFEEGIFDEEKEIVVEDPNRDADKTTGVDLDGDGDPDIIILGTKDDVKRSDNTDIDGDGEDEIVLEDPDRKPDDPEKIDLDGDGDADVIILGTKNE